MNLEEHKLHAKYKEHLKQLRNVVDSSALSENDKIRVYEKAKSRVLNGDIEGIDADTTIEKIVRLFIWTCNYFNVEVSFNNNYNSVETRDIVVVNTGIRGIIYYKDNILLIPDKYKDFLREYLVSGLPLDVLNDRIKYVLSLSYMDLFTLSYIYSLNVTADIIHYNNIITNIRDVDNILKSVRNLFRKYVDDSIVNILAATCLRKVLLDNTYKLEEIPRLALERLPEVMDNALVDRRRLVNDLCKGLK